MMSEMQEPTIEQLREREQQARAALRNAMRETLRSMDAEERAEQPKQPGLSAEEFEMLCQWVRDDALAGVEGAEREYIANWVRQLMDTVEVVRYRYRPAAKILADCRRERIEMRASGDELQIRRGAASAASDRRLEEVRRNFAPYVHEACHFLGERPEQTPWEKYWEKTYGTKGAKAKEPSSKALKLLRTADVAKLCGVSESVVLAAAADGSLPCYRLGERVIRYDQDQVRKWFFQSQEPPPRP